MASLQRKIVATKKKPAKVTKSRAPVKPTSTPIYPNPFKSPLQAKINSLAKKGKLFP